MSTPLPSDLTRTFTLKSTTRLTGTKTFMTGLQSLLINVDVDVKVSFAFYAAAFLVRGSAYPLPK
jgi:hypothetical protein